MRRENDAIPQHVWDEHRPWLESPKAVAAELGITTAECLRRARGESAPFDFSLHLVREGCGAVDLPAAPSRADGAHNVSTVRCSMRVLIACEFSGTVRDAFTEEGYYAMSCDVLPSETPGEHYQGDVRDVLEAGWDLMIAHPPCTHLAVSGARWFKDKRDDQAHALGFVMQLAAAPIEHIAIENPVSILSSRWRKPDQIIQPWQYGHGETKATCLWLKNLQPLRPTLVVEGRESRIHKMPPSADRSKERSRTYPGVAAAMAAQWGLRARTRLWNRNADSQSGSLNAR